MRLGQPLDKVPHLSASTLGAFQLLVQTQAPRDVASEGRAHPMLEGRPGAYDAPAIHTDEVEALPSTKSAEFWLSRGSPAEPRGREVSPASGSARAKGRCNPNDGKRHLGRNHTEAAPGREQGG